MKAVVLYGYDDNVIEKFTDVYEVVSPFDYITSSHKLQKSKNGKVSLVVSPTACRHYDITPTAVEDSLTKPTTAFACTETVELLSPTDPDEFSTMFLVKNTHRLRDASYGTFSNVSATEDADIIVVCHEIDIPVFTVGIEYGFTYC